jgi:hypothetical protein
VSKARLRQAFFCFSTVYQLAVFKQAGTASNPDRAVLVEMDEGERLYLVVETESSLFTADLRDREGAKIACGRARLAALQMSESPARCRCPIDRRCPYGTT